MLADEMAGSGRWLFRYRSYLPLLLLPLAAVEMAAVGPLGFDFATQMAWDGACVAVVLAGIVIRMATIGYAPPGTSGRTTGRPKARELNTTGAYSLARNPLYLGNILIYTGVLLTVGSWRLVLLAVPLFLLYYERIIAAEEEILLATFGDAFRDWAVKTPCLLPRFGAWKAPDRAFRWGKSLREFYAVFGAASAIFLVKTSGEWLRLVRGGCLTSVEALKATRIDPVWGGVFAATGLMFVVLRTIKKRTRLLRD